jgi:pimeloyl-ACP methyl ester carboxylesterase
MATAYIDRLRINYTDQGQGEPTLLCMPGWGADHTAFDQLVAPCSQQHRTLALDWRGHGRSETPASDFGFDDLVKDALAVIEASAAEQIVPVALSHAGWVAIELRRRLGERIPKLVLIEWIVLEAPAPFLASLEAFQDPQRWEQAREQLFVRWLHGVDNAEEIRFVREVMGAHGYALWSRAGREIGAAYAQAGSPLRALARLDPPAPALHLYATPPDPAYLAAQQTFAADHPWFHIHKLSTPGHFPMFEVPDEMAAAVERFVGI